MSDLPDYVLDNREHWDRQSPQWVAMGERGWNEDPTWGWGIPEHELSLLPEDMTRMDAIELECGAAYVSGWMVQRGASVVGVDNSARQLETARRLAVEHGAELELIQGNARASLSRTSPSTLPSLSTGRPSAVTPTYGFRGVAAAATRWRPVFPGPSPLGDGCPTPRGEREVTRELLYAYFKLHRVDWMEGEDKGTEFNLPMSEWMRLVDDVGFDVLDFHEIRNPSRDAPVRFHIDAGWAYDFPSEQAWRLRKR